MMSQIHNCVTRPYVLIRPIMAETSLNFLGEKSALTPKYFVYKMYNNGYTLMRRVVTGTALYGKKIFCMEKFFELNRVLFEYTFLHDFLNNITFLKEMVTIHGRQTCH